MVPGQAHAIAFSLFLTFTGKPHEMEKVMGCEAGVGVEFGDAFHPRAVFQVLVKQRGDTHAAGIRVYEDHVDITIDPVSKTHQRVVPFGDYGFPFTESGNQALVALCAAPGIPLLLVVLVGGADLDGLAEYAQQFTQVGAFQWANLEGQKQGQRIVNSVGGILGDVGWSGRFRCGRSGGRRGPMGATEQAL